MTFSNNGPLCHFNGEPASELQLQRLDQIAVTATAGSETTVSKSRYHETASGYCIIKALSTTPIDGGWYDGDPAASGVPYGFEIDITSADELDVLATVQHDRRKPEGNQFSFLLCTTDIAHAVNVALELGSSDSDDSTRHIISNLFLGLMHGRLEDSPSASTPSQDDLTHIGLTVSDSIHATVDRLSEMHIISRDFFGTHNNDSISAMHATAITEPSATSPLVVPDVVTVELATKSEVLLYARQTDDGAFFRRISTNEEPVSELADHELALRYEFDDAMGKHIPSADDIRKMSAALNAQLDPQLSFDIP